MNRPTRNFVGVALALLLGGCSLSGLLGGGAKVPPTLQTLTSEAADPGQIARSANAGQAVTIAIPVVPKELRTVRVPVQLSQVGWSNPQLTFGQADEVATKGPLTVEKDEAATIGHPENPGRFRFRVMYESSPGKGFTTEIHGESSPEIIIDQ